MDESFPSLTARDGAVIASAEHLRFYPLEIDRAAGAVLHTPDGRQLIDLSGSWGAATVGYAHPRVVEAVMRAVARMPGASILSATHPLAVELAERLLELIPSRGGDRAVYLGHAGSDANSAVLRAVRAASDRPGVLVFEQSYHGGLGPAQHASGLFNSAGVPLDDGVHVIPYNDCDRASEALGTARFAAVLVEPILSDGGLIFPDPKFLTKLREACDRSGTLLIVDEVKVGLGRTGELLASGGAHGIEADIVTLGKGLGGGLPLSAAIAPRSIWDAAAGSSLLTTAGNPVCAAAGLAVLETIVEERLAERALVLGQHLDGLLRDLASRHPLVRDVRSRGLVAGIELGPAGGGPGTAETAATVYRAHKLGAVAYPVGPHSNVIELTPPLVIGTDQLDRGIGALSAALGDVAAGAVDAAEVARYGGW
jgi:4-aminobutyrate aminotransferase